jgi:hypothetical protein
MGGKRREPTTTPAGRFIRGRRFDRNPLRRSSDRAETSLLALLVLVFLACAPLAALGTGTWAHARAQQAANTQLATRYQVMAVTLGPMQAEPSSGLVAHEAKARWTAPDGRVVTDTLPVPAGTKAGTKIPLWVTGDGQAALQPMSESGVTSLTVLGGAVGPIALAILLTGSGLLARRSIDKRRMAAWDADWRATAPRWTTRA